ncbi:hypothetical protein CM15mP35_09060 [bacterium]|nr:MAG: hypothetical protein CM15mP35_09060 [bacterium]
MEFLDTPNPNAKKILIDHDLETSVYLNDSSSTTSSEISILLKTSGIKIYSLAPDLSQLQKMIPLLGMT